MNTNKQQSSTKDGPSSSRARNASPGFWQLTRPTMNRILRNGASIDQYHIYG